MADENALVSGSTASICPWCSATLPSADEVSCPSCGATLTADVEPQLPGVTAIDAEAIARASQAPVRQPRSRLLSWISGEYDAGEGAPADSDALAPPDGAVKREILRLELEAEVANLQAENEALIAEARLEEVDAGIVADGIELDADGEAAAADEPVDEPTVAATADARREEAR
jgi:hypothetical protein